MLLLKSSKSEPFDGRRDSLTVNTWIFQVGVDLNLVQMANTSPMFDDNMNISIAYTLLKANTANWWFSEVQAGNTHPQW